MILNLQGKVVNSTIQFDLPPLFFQRNHFVHVNYIFIKWNQAVGNFYGEITTSLIDRTPYNPSQEILLFSQTKKSNYLLFSPTHLSKYKIQCPSLQSSVFNISLSEKHQIQEIKLQLEITHEGL